MSLFEFLALVGVFTIAYQLLRIAIALEKLHGVSFFYASRGIPVPDSLSPEIREEPRFYRPGRHAEHP